MADETKLQRKSQESKVTEAPGKGESLAECRGIISQEAALNLFAITSLVYVYGNNPAFRLEEDERFSSFLERVEAQGPLEDVLDLKRAYRVGMIQHLVERVPDATIVDFFDHSQTSDLQAGICCSEEQRSIVVVFRGSDSNMDWLHNAMAWNIALGSEDDRSLYVHRGFKAHLDPALNELLTALRKHHDEHKNFKVYITGHSLGGAICTLFGFEAARAWPDIDIHVVSVGAPRVGTPAFADAFHAQRNLRHSRIAQAGDMVTAIPMMGYRHCGDVVKLYKKESKVFKRDGDYYSTWWEFSLFNNLDWAAHDLGAYFDQARRNPW